MKSIFSSSARRPKTLVALFAAALTVITAHAGLPIEHWVRSDGARVYLVRTNALPMLDVQIDIDAGSRRDPAPQAGLAQVTAAMLAKGSGQVGDRPALDENAAVEAWADLGAQFNVQASSDRMSFQLRTLVEPRVLSAAVALASQQLAAPTFPEVVWGRERQRLTAAWREAQTRPDVLAERRFAQAVYGPHPYGQEARPHTWDAIQTETMRTFYRRHAQVCGARVTLVGQVDRAAADGVVDRLLVGWTPHGCAALPPVPEVPETSASVDLRLPFDAAQAQVLMGQRGMARSDPDFLALTVGNHILGGGGFTSRLMQELREKRGLTYGVQSYFSPGRHAGAFVASVQTRPDQAREAVELLRRELRRFVTEGPTEQELIDAKAALVNGFALRLDSNRKLLDNVAALAWNDMPLDYLDRWTTLVSAIGREQVARALGRVLHPDHWITVVVGGAP